MTHDESNTPPSPFDQSTFDKLDDVCGNKQHGSRENSMFEIPVRQLNDATDNADARGVFWIWSRPNHVLRNKMLLARSQ